MSWKDGGEETSPNITAKNFRSKPEAPYNIIEYSVAMHDSVPFLYSNKISSFGRYMHVSIKKSWKQVGGRHGMAV